MSRCFYHSLPFTRSRRPCFGVPTSFSGRNARERGFFDDVQLCLRHSREEHAKYHRCAVLFDVSRCRDPLRPCPERPQSVLDDITGNPAAFICRCHIEEIDSIERVTSHPQYRPSAKRRAAVSATQSRPEVRAFLCSLVRAR